MTTPSTMTNTELRDEAAALTTEINVLFATGRHEQARELAKRHGAINHELKDRAELRAKGNAHV